MKHLKLLLAVASLFLLGSAWAGECALKDASRDTGWLLRFNDAQVASCTFVGNVGTGRNKGTLNLALTINNENPVNVEFVQVNTALVDSFGMRITMNLTINNNWAAMDRFRGEAVDLNPELEKDFNAFVSDEHPGKAHFHQDASFSAGPFRTTTCQCESNDDFRIEGGGNVFGFGTQTIKGIGVHQIEHAGFKRSFVLSMRPHN